MSSIIDPNQIKKDYFLEKGGFGQVWVGSYNNQKVAIKCYTRTNKYKTSIEESFLQEIKLLFIL